MTPDEFADKLRRNLQEIEQRDTPLRIASLAAHSDMAKRIFIEGEDANNSKIGDYSTTSPEYVTPEGYLDFSALKPPKGKTGQTTFKNGKKHKSTYVKNYKNLRNIIGRQNEKVDFFIRGDFRSDFIANTSGEVLPKPELRELNVNEYYSAFSRSKDGISHGELSRAFEKKYGTQIWKLTEQEKETFYDTAETVLKDILES